MPGMKTMRYCVLQTGTAMPMARSRLGGYGGMFVDILRSAGHQGEVCDAEKGRFPEDPAAYDGHIITGSPFSVNDPLPWIQDLFSFIREVCRRGTPLLGVCFGHQAVARALGGEVGLNPRGWELGIRRIRLTGEGERFFPVNVKRQTLKILESHRDIVSRVPTGAVLLAESDNTGVEMFAVNDNVLCVQGHPEFDREVLREIAATLGHRGAISPEQQQSVLASLEEAPDRRHLREMMIGFLEGRPSFQ
jgi:GMP synthase-like glutamine amidotransferase